MVIHVCLFSAFTKHKVHNTGNNVSIPSMWGKLLIQAYMIFEPIVSTPRPVFFEESRSSCLFSVISDVDNLFFFPLLFKIKVIRLIQMCWGKKNIAYKSMSINNWHHEHLIMSSLCIYEAEGAYLSRDPMVSSSESVPCEVSWCCDILGTRSTDGSALFLVLQ